MTSSPRSSTSSSFSGMGTWGFMLCESRPTVIYIPNETSKKFAEEKAPGVARLAARPASGAGFRPLQAKDTDLLRPTLSIPTKAGMAGQPFAALLSTLPDRFRRAPRAHCIRRCRQSCGSPLSFRLSDPDQCLFEGPGWRVLVAHGCDIEKTDVKPVIFPSLRTTHAMIVIPVIRTG